jgi:hypothetical protein
MLVTCQLNHAVSYNNVSSNSVSYNGMSSDTVLFISVLVVIMC